MKNFFLIHGDGDVESFSNTESTRKAIKRLVEKEEDKDLILIQGRELKITFDKVILKAGNKTLK